jgi:hypothetical protein
MPSSLRGQFLFYERLAHYTRRLQAHPGINSRKAPVHAESGDGQPTSNPYTLLRRMDKCVKYPTKPIQGLCIFAPPIFHFDIVQLSMYRWAIALHLVTLACQKPKSGPPNP